MDLDNHNEYSKIDKQDMLTQINHLPTQLQSAWELGNTFDLPNWHGIQGVLIAGMGGSAIGADLLSAYVNPYCPVPVVVQRDYGLPGWINGPDTLVIVSSHSGNTEEALSIFYQTQEKNCPRLMISTGGELARLALEYEVPIWRFNHSGQPRAAVGFSFGLLLSLFYRLGLIPDPSQELIEAVAIMHEQQSNLEPQIPVIRNFAKRLAGQLLDRWVIVLGSDVLAPVARRWKGQINEIGKSLAQFEFLPEADHNTLAGIENPMNLLPNTYALFLQAPSDHPRNQLRTELTRRLFMLQGIGTDIIEANGESRLAHQWSSLHLGDYVAYYLAMAYKVDPTPVEAIEGLKQELDN